MPFRQIQALKIYQFDSLCFDGLVHGIATRHGGVSPNPWRSLNLSRVVGDEPDHVLVNRARFLTAMGRSAESLHQIWQIHSARVHFVHEPLGAAPPEKADVVVTDRPEVTLIMVFADCVPIMLFDPKHRVIALVHAGWRGTLKKAAVAAVLAMQDHYSSQPADIRAAIGPSIGPERYEVGPEVVAQVREVFGRDAEQHLLKRGDKTHFNLWSANQAQLEAYGVGAIEVAGICTAQNVADWFSHRAEDGRTGRFAALIGLVPE